MSTQNQLYTEGEIITFSEKLAEFHAALSPREQAILDDMTVAALSAPQSEVQGYSQTPLFQSSPIGSRILEDLLAKYGGLHNAGDTGHLTPRPGQPPRG